MRQYEQPPDPSRLAEGMRDTGYDFNTAIADIVDNSIAAESTTIKIEINMAPNGSVTLSIADDGIGMSEEELIEGMQYGAKTRYHPLSLGKFGLGLKTASSAFCRRLNVITRDAEGKSSKAIWDLDVIKEEGKWILLLEEPSERDMQILDHVSGVKTGTVVLWDKVDRLLKQYSVPGGGHARNALRDVRDDLAFHLAKVFQRFLDRDDARVSSKVSIFLNEKQIEPWDPFRYGEFAIGKSHSIFYESENGKKEMLGEFELNAYLFPPSDEMNEDELAYSQIKVPNQGIYVYRENRLIHGPDGLGYGISIKPEINSEWTFLSKMTLMNFFKLILKSPE